MNPELEKKWRELEAGALARLRAGGEDEPGYVVDAHVIEHASFTDCLSYQLTRSVRDDAAPAIAHVLTWRQQDDSAKLETPVTRLRHERPLVPTIDAERVVLPLSDAKALLDALAQVSIPPVPADARLGADGTSYELSVGGFFVSSRFTWWESAPRGWEPLETFVRDLRALIARSSKSAR